MMANLTRDHDYVRSAIDDCFSGVDTMPSLRSDIMRKVRGEVKLKKKLSAGFVLVIVLVLIAVTALAIVSLTQTAQLMAQTEKEDGDFAYWPVETKVKVIRELNTEGYIETDDQLRKLASGNISLEEADSLADAIIENFTYEEARYVSFLVIMTSAWGEFDTWTTEQKAWYSEIVLDAGISEIGDHTIYTLPNGEVSEAEALEVARQAMMQVYEIDDSTLDAYDILVTFEIPEFVSDGQSYWAITFEAPADMSEEERQFELRTIYVHPDTGKLYQSVESMMATETTITQSGNEIFTAIRELSAKTDSGEFRHWPLELKAEFSEIVSPLVRAVMDSGDLAPLISGGGVQIGVMAQSTYTYGLPTADDISQEQALSLAKQALNQQYDIGLDVLELYEEISVYYDVTNPDQPLWKFLFNPKSLHELEAGDPLKSICYKVEMDARTGEIALLDEFSWQWLGQDYDYDVKWY